MNIYKLVTVVLIAALVALLLASAFNGFTRAPETALAAGANFIVDSTLDEPNPDPSTGICTSSPSGKCTLRAAVQVANFVSAPNTITLPAGTYTLTRSGYDDIALVGDLDLAKDVTIQGAGSGATIVDGNGGVTNDRVFQILSSATHVMMTGMTVRNGVSVSSTVGVIGGGGLYIEGAGSVVLNDVIFDGNTGQNGGGVYANFANTGGSLEMDNVVLHANTAVAGGVGEGGGAFVYMPASGSHFVIKDSTVYSNTADGTGGGIFIEGNTTNQWSMQRTHMYLNKAASAGAIGNLVPGAISDSRFDHNSVTFDGGVIQAFSPITLVRSTLDANSAARYGGAIFDLQTAGLAPNQEFAHIEGTTLSNNFALYGGAIYHDGFITPNSRLVLLNSTLSGNGVSKNGNGGGLFVYGGQAHLLNSTVAFNRVYLGIFPRGTGIGAGLYITASATFTAQNSLIAENARGNGITLDTPDDCFSSGTVGELAYNLILTTTNCFVTGPQGGNIVGRDPLLGPLEYNGGPTWTRALLPGSPAIDAGAPAGCTDENGASLTTDQRGLVRPYGAGCDMGAYERHPDLFIPIIRRQ
ncbi:MAG TPA: choice-of-anchor Q domain-containing protein [Anaerolineae bacterium]